MSEGEQREAYERFAAQTYATFHGKISQAVGASPAGGSVLVVIGEEHQDSTLEMFLNNKVAPEDRQPAVASAFSHISALHSAVQIAGARNVVFSTELSPDVLEPIRKLLEKEIKANPGKEFSIPEFESKYADVFMNQMDKPFLHAMAYAIKNNIPIVGSDPLGGQKAQPSYNPAREQAQVDAITTLSGRDKKIVIHIAGQSHLSNLMGYSDEEVTAREGNFVAQAERNPFLSSFPQRLYFNTSRDTAPYRETQEIVAPLYAGYARMHRFNELAESRFATNPQNAIQIVTPGGIPRGVVERIESMVVDAGSEFAKGKAVLTQGAGQAVNPVQGR